MDVSKGSRIPPPLEHGTWHISDVWTLAIFAWRWDTGQSTPQHVDPPDAPWSGAATLSITVPEEQ